MGPPPRVLSKFVRLDCGKELEVELVESALLKDAKSEEEKKKRINSIRFLNSAFPFIVPAAQHTMALRPEASNRDGNYWGNAMHFLLCSKAHGFPMWKKLEQQIRSVVDVKDPCKPHISTVTTNKYFNHRRDISATEDELFELLLNDAVFIQLPFQPVMLFQYLTASMQLALNFEAVITEFYYYPVPEKYKPELLRFHKMLESAQVNLGFLFDYLQRQVESENEIFVGHLKTFEKILNELNVSNLFMLDEKLKNRLNKLKAECWGKSNPKQNLWQLKKGRLPLSERNFIFNLDFWRGHCPDLKIFGSSDEKLVRKQNLEGGGEEMNYQGIWDILLPFENAPCVVDKKVISSDGFRSYQNAKRELELLRIRDEEIGIIGTILFQVAKNKTQSALLEIRRFVQDKYKWKLIRKYPSEIDENCDKIGDIKVNPISFESIISDIVKNEEFNMPALMDCIDAQLKIRNFEKEKDEVLRDWQVAHYLLPCFLRMAIDIHSLGPPIKATYNWCSNFNYELFKKYEIDGIRKSSWFNIKKDIEENSILRNNEELLKFFQDVTNTFNAKLFSDKGNIGRYAKFCPSLKMLYEVLANGSGHDDELASEPCVYWNWLMWDFFGKIKHAISALDEKNVDQQQIVIIEALKK